MIVLIVGRPDSGKSRRAEELALTLSENGKRIYLATMIPFGEEGEKRIQKHRKMREGKGFSTVECPTDIADILENEEELKNATCLLECVSNLVGNEMHKKGQEDWSDRQLVDKITADIKRISQKCSDMVIVTNRFEAEPSFDEDTLRYVKLLEAVNEELKGFADRIEDITGEEWQIYENN